MNRIIQFSHGIYTKLTRIESTVPNRFDHLDGFRGFLAILVVCQHSLSHLPLSGDYKIFEQVGNYIGVSGFFELSSFLLTYRLLKDFDRSINSHFDTAIVVLKYAVKRFFRIYVTFVIFVTILKTNVKLFGGIWGFSSWYSLVTLQSCGFSHLWTIAPEIKFYFLIPFIAYAAIAAGSRWGIFWLASVAFIFLNQFYLNILNVQPTDFTLELSYKLATWLPMFLCGTYMTIFYYKLEKSVHMKALKAEDVQRVISWLTIFMFLFGLRIFSGYWKEHNPEYLENNKNIVSGFYWSIFLFFFLVGEPNSLTRMFASSSILKNFGKYSFGIYLIHSMFIPIVKENYFPRTDFERLLAVTVMAYLSGVIWFHVVENPLINLANRVCKFIDARAALSKSTV